MLDELFLLSRDYIRLLNQSYVRYFLKTHTMDSRMSIITGPRGIGKTTTLIQTILANYPNPISKEALYISADHRSVQNHTLYAIAEAFYKNEGKLLCIDEIHKADNWSGELKMIHDAFPGLRVIATGSSALELSHGSHDLSRRAVVYAMHGLSFREFIEMETHVTLEPITLESLIGNHEHHAYEIIRDVEEKGRKILGLFGEYLQWGYYPYYQEYSDKSKFAMTLDQQVTTTLESDFLAVYPSFNGLSVRKMKKLMAIIAQSSPFTLEIKVLKEASEIHDDRTLKNYLYFLQKSGLVRFMYRSRTGLRAMEKPEKITLGNPNLIHAMGANTGTLRETFFASMVENGDHSLILAKKGDFEIDSRYVFEVGGSNKTFSQIKGVEESYLALDEIEHGIGRKIPLWMFGFLY
jgi:predicted AAA+ superfamily ATPase